jgi:glycosyltransferase involved in cell wall biosynthesis
VLDAEVPSYFDAADLVALPYHRSSASGPLHLAMARGVPVVITRVGGLQEAAADYAGAVFVPPKDPEALARGIENARSLVGQIFTDPSSWDATAKSYSSIFAELGDFKQTERTDTET